jgi:hypothetical protein
MHALCITAHKTLKNMAEFKYTETTATNKNGIHEEIKNSLKIQGILAINQFRIIHLPVCYLKRLK